MNLMNLQKILDEQYAKHLPCLDGHLADYIPELGNADINEFSIVIVTVDGQIFKTGNSSSKSICSLNALDTMLP